MELVANGAVFPNFQIISNELYTPKLLICPEDKERSYATNFSSSLTDTNLSYFLNIDSIDGNGSLLVCGDRNLTNRPIAGSRFINITKDTTIAWTEEIHSEKGNVCFGDGSAGLYVNQNVSAVIRLAAGMTNRLPSRRNMNRNLTNRSQIERLCGAPEIVRWLNNNPICSSHFWSSL